MPRPPRLAICVMPRLEHFTPDLVRGLRATGRIEARVFDIGAQGLGPALAWTEAPGDAVWFEFCWPPFPTLIRETRFGARRVIVRVHRIEAYGTDHVAQTDWSHVDDLIVVGQDMHRRVLAAAPELRFTTRVHAVHNGVDTARFAPLLRFDPYRVGWCGWFTLHKNPGLALEILHRLRRLDSRYRLAVSSKAGDPIAVDSFHHLAARLDLAEAIDFDGPIAPEAMPQWHARNGVLLSTSVYESFGYAIAEAACAGCDIAMLDHAAAGEFWPEETRFACVDEAVAMIRAARPHRWRALVEERYGLALQAARVLEIVQPSAAPAAAAA
jgi:glycosyltransferase involved in cell wall biosynthesis